MNTIEEIKIKESENVLDSIGNELNEIHFLRTAFTPFDDTITSGSLCISGCCSCSTGTNTQHCGSTLCSTGCCSCSTGTNSRHC
jgi:hypothetical protein